MLCLGIFDNVVVGVEDVLIMLDWIEGWVLLFFVVDDSEYFFVKIVIY